MKSSRAGIVLGPAVAALVFAASAAPAAPAKTSRGAGQIMSRFVRNTRELRRFILVMEIQSQGSGDSRSLKRVERVRVAYDGPRRVAVRLLEFRATGPGEESAHPFYYDEIVADGNRYYALYPGRREYVLHKLHPRGFAADRHGAGIFSDFTFGDILTSPADDTRWQFGTGGKTLAPQTADGAVCDRIQFLEDAEILGGGREKVETVYWISRKDGLLRRVESKSPLSHLTEIYRLQQVGGVISPGEFRISPPASAKREK